MRVECVPCQPRSSISWLVRPDRRVAVRAAIDSPQRQSGVAVAERIERRAVTLRDVAEASGVSISTVSRILDDRIPQSRSSTAERVRQTADELGYRRNAAASGLRRGATGTIGVLVPAADRHGHGADVRGDGARSAHARVLRRRRHLAAMSRMKSVVRPRRCSIAASTRSSSPRHGSATCCPPRCGIAASRTFSFCARTASARHRSATTRWAAISPSDTSSTSDIATSPWSPAPTSPRAREPASPAPSGDDRGGHGNCPSDRVLSGGYGVDDGVAAGEILFRRRRRARRRSSPRTTTSRSV